ncbi:hypothetical protein PTTG_01910 [Puccinia triticina 1-1 BBBD Race 1]|uniref:Uncharacterized protein n=1 Tax=Puccinia triticina (isolate 1-1 / race 1 (BBBD)) TaxID=630390 RepID=A0A180GXN4_PUCT1|nr:hypothetical protein PTTG_01910 [Puccinia triticina 1-1 BBBD Race 1]
MCVEPTREDRAAKHRQNNFMLLNIEGTTSLLAQVVTPKTFLAALITLDGRVVAFHIHPSAIVADEDEQSDGSDQAKIAAAIASGLWREDCYQRPFSSTSKTEVAREVRNLDAVCERTLCILFDASARSVASQFHTALSTRTRRKDWIRFHRHVVHEGPVITRSVERPIFQYCILKFSLEVSTMYPDLRGGGGGGGPWG